VAEGSSKDGGAETTAHADSSDTAQGVAAPDKPADKSKNGSPVSLDAHTVERMISTALENQRKQFEHVTAKHQDDLIKLRKRLRDLGGDDVKPGSGGVDDGDKPLTISQFRALLKEDNDQRAAQTQQGEFDRLSSELSDAQSELIAEDLKEAETIGERLRIVRRALRVQAQASNHRGQAPVRSGRGHPPGTRNDGGTPHPRTRKEYLELSKEQRARLNDDPSFDPTW